MQAPAANGAAGTTISQRQSNMSVPRKSSSDRTANATVTAIAKWNASAFHNRRRLARVMTSDSMFVAHPQVGWNAHRGWPTISPRKGIKKTYGYDDPKNHE
jgi:hypothetical protein